MAEFYKKKYKIDFEYLGETEEQFTSVYGVTRSRINSSNQREIKISLNPLMMKDDLDLKLGTLRHEIEHAIDKYQAPGFKSIKFQKKDIADMTFGEAIEDMTKGHFSKYPDVNFEISYIINDKINNMLKDGKINSETVELLDLQLPKNTGTEDIVAFSNMIDSVKGIKDPGKKIAELRKSLVSMLSGKMIYQKYFGKLKTLDKLHHL